MDAVIKDFEDRVDELDRYFRLLKLLNEPSAAVMYSTHGGRRTRTESVDQDSTKMLKATAFLLLYNMIESSIRASFVSLYQTIKKEGGTIDVLREEISKIWIDQKFRQIDGFSASARTYQEMAEELVRSVANQAIVDLDAKKLPVSGNLDADEVRRVCRKHGISDITYKSAKGGYELTVVKSQRNALAHGNTTFLECGRQYSIDDLERIKKQTTLFVKSILKNIKEYVRKKKYAA